MEADDLLCSRNARPEKALVGRAQWKINQPPSLEKSEQAWKEHIYRSTCAVEDQPGHPLGSVTSKLGGMGRTPTLVLCSRNARPEKGLVRRPHVDQYGCPSQRRKSKRACSSLVPATLAIRAFPARRACLAAISLQSSPLITL